MSVTRADAGETHDTARLGPRIRAGRGCERVLPAALSIALAAQAAIVGVAADPPAEGAAGVTTSAPVTVNGASFATAATSRWTVPADNDRRGTDVYLALVVTNVSDAPLRLAQGPATSVRMAGPDGAEIAPGFGRNPTKRGGRVSQALPPSASLTVERRAKLVRTSRHGPFRLTGEDESGHRWYVDGLRADRYRVWLVHEYHESGTAGGDRIWTGRVATEPVEIELR